MKANEAPENIYLHIRPNKEIGSTWHGNKISDTDIEYTRTDVFIEKACKWFRKIDYDDTEPPYETTEEFIKGFKKAMKL